MGDLHELFVEGPGGVGDGPPGRWARDVAAMRGELEGTLAQAITSRKFGFDDVKRVALGALGEIAADRELARPLAGRGAAP